MKTKRSPRREPADYFAIGAAQKEQERRVWLEANKPQSDPPSLYENSRARAEFWQQFFTWRYLESSPTFQPGPNTTWHDYAVEAGREHATEALRHLQSLAGQNQDALAAIADVAISATSVLTNFSTSTPRRVRPIAHQRFFWPFLKARKERFGDEHERLIQDIQLGRDAPFSEVAASRIRADNRAVKTAMMLLCRIESERHKNPAIERLLSKPLPEWKEKAWRLRTFSVKTWSAWFEVAWKALLVCHKGHPEHDPELRRIGMYRADHSTERYEGTQKVATAKTRDANVQDGIRESLRKAVMRLADLPKKTSKK